MPEPHVRTTRYSVNCLPEDDINASAYEITVEYRGHDLWAVLLRGVYCLGSDGEWDYEMRPSEREDHWLADHRFPEQRALQLAKEAAPQLTCNGRTVAEALARSADSGAAR